MKGLFGDLFDFNHDGELDSIEMAAEMAFFEELTRPKKGKNDWEFELDEAEEDEEDY